MSVRDFLHPACKTSGKIQVFWSYRKKHVFCQNAAVFQNGNLLRKVLNQQLVGSCLEISAVSGWMDFCWGLLLFKGLIKVNIQKFHEFFPAALYIYIYIWAYIYIYTHIPIHNVWYILIFSFLLSILTLTPLQNPVCHVNEFNMAVKDFPSFPCMP